MRVLPCPLPCLRGAPCPALAASGGIGCLPGCCCAATGPSWLPSLCFPVSSQHPGPAISGPCNQRGWLPLGRCFGCRWQLLVTPWQPGDNWPPPWVGVSFWQRVLWALETSEFQACRWLRTWPGQAALTTAAAFTPRFALPLQSALNPVDVFQGPLVLRAPTLVLGVLHISFTLC